MKKKIIIDIPLNTILSLNELNNYRSFTQQWIDYRIDLFMNYTAKSIINQTNQDFLCVVHYERRTKEQINKSLSRYPKLPDNIVFTSIGDDLIVQSLQGYEYIYRLRLDSDNVIHPTFIEQLNNIKYYEGLKCIIGRCGYLYDTHTNRLALWNHDSSAFNTYISTVNEYINCGYKPSENVESHHLDVKRYTHEFLYVNNNDGRSYVIIVHGSNIANHFDGLLYEFSEWYPGLIYDEKVKNGILNEFNISVI